MDVKATAAYTGGTPPNWTLEVPDLASAGYDQAWGLRPGLPLDWNVIAIGGSIRPLLGATPVDGERTLAAGVVAAHPARRINDYASPGGEPVACDRAARATDGRTGIVPKLRGTRAVLCPMLLRLGSIMSNVAGNGSPPAPEGFARAHRWEYSLGGIFKLGLGVALLTHETHEASSAPSSTGSPDPQLLLEAKARERQESKALGRWAWEGGRTE